MKTYRNVHDLHKTYCKTKNLENFWRSKNFLLCQKILSDKGHTAKITEQHSAPMMQSVVKIHPLVVFEFLRWGAPDKAYELIMEMLDANAEAT